MTPETSAFEVLWNRIHRTIDYVGVHFTNLFIYLGLLINFLIKCVALIVCSSRERIIFSSGKLIELVTN